MKDNLQKGIFFALLTSIISGIAIFYAKLTVVKIDPLVLTTSRNLVVGLLFLVLFFATNKFGELKKLNKSQWLNLVLIGLIGGALPFFLFFTGLKMIGAANANLIHKSLFIWVSILSIIFLKEKFNVSYWLGFVLVLLGTFVFAGQKLTLGYGEMLVLSATILWAVENILAKKVLKNVSSELVGLFRMGIGSIVLFLAVVTSGKLSLVISLSLDKIIPIVIGGVILSFYVYFWYKALKYAPAGLVALILTFSIVVGSVLNSSFVGVKLAVNDIYTHILITGSVVLVFFNYFKDQTSKIKSITKS